VRARIWGCRGSLASPGPETVRYGGNTSCIEVRPSDDHLIVIDAGTGIRALGIALGRDAPGRIDILFSHLHLDHIEGLGFFKPLWDKSCEIHLWGPSSAQKTLREDIARYFSPPLFPLHLDEIPAKLHFHDLPVEEWDIGITRIRSDAVIHRGPTVGYRMEDEGKVLAYLSDHEPAVGIDLLSVSPDWVSGYGVARGADVLFHDAQYTEEEYEEKVGWGHSSIAHTVTFGLISKVRKLILFHHDPLHSDAQLEAMLIRAKELWGQERNGLALAYEGMEIQVV
jgi:phosphoribosyl 1,2-cyclic phosphodiesterase